MWWTQTTAVGQIGAGWAKPSRSMRLSAGSQEYTQPYAPSPRNVRWAVWTNCHDNIYKRYGLMFRSLSLSYFEKPLLLNRQNLLLLFTRQNLNQYSNINTIGIFRMKLIENDYGVWYFYIYINLSLFAVHINTNPVNKNRKLCVGPIYLQIPSRLRSITVEQLFL